MRKPNLKTASPDELVAYLRFKVKQAFGDAVENESKIIARNHGWYDVLLALPEYPNGFHFGPFQRNDIPALLDLITSKGEAAKGTKKSKK